MENKFNFNIKGHKIQNRNAILYDYGVRECDNNYFLKYFFFKIY